MSVRAKLDDDWRVRRGRVPEGSTVPGRVRRADKTFASQSSREVVIRVTGRTKSASGLVAQLAYNSRQGTLPGELSNGRTLHGMDNIRALRDRWVADNAAYARHPSCPTQSLGVVLSMPEGTPHAAMVEATRAWAREHISPTTEWFAVQHADRAHYHSHVAVRIVQLDGYRVRATLDDVQEWRETFARSLQQRGVEALATPRREKVQRDLERQHERGVMLLEMRLER